jgi:tripartite-type tricarboxylate transporter receptor subunit TctC
MTSYPNLLVIRPDFPANTVQELIAYAKANPAKLNFASQGIGTTPHLTGELFARVTGTQLVHVPYRGTAQAVNDIVASHVDMMFLELSATLNSIKPGAQKFSPCLATSPVLPNIPTLQELPLPTSVSHLSTGRTAENTGRCCCSQNAAINEVFQMPDIKAHLATLNMQPVGGTSAQMKIPKFETKRWGAVIRAANVTVN